MKNQKADMFVIGLALFSMFFGAGNIIFPPFLGMQAGASWGLGFVSYYIADIGLALVAIFAMLRANTDFAGMMSHIGKIPAVILSCATVLCIGPGIAIPRTAATTYEMGVMPIFGLEAGNVAVTAITSVVFFAITIVLSLNESSVLDIIGKFLTPVLFIGLLIMIIKGFISPIAPISDTTQLESVVQTGVLSGYQTLDVLAALCFGVIILKTVKDKGYTSIGEKNLVTGGAAIVAGIGLLIIYGGLTYLGATMSTLHTGDSITRANLIVEIVQSLLGQGGVIFLGVVVSFACLTTSVGLASSCGSFFEELTKGKVSYKQVVIITCVVSAVLANVGLDTIVSISAPILDLVYPAALAVIVLALFANNIKNDNIYKAAALGAFIMSILTTASNYGVTACDFVKSLPFATYGFNWLVPTIICGVIGAFIKDKNAGLAVADDEETVEE